MTDSVPTLTCANHPQVETSLRCNRCEKPICVKCAILTPTGYRCKECVRGQQKVFDTAHNFDYPIAFVIAAALTFLGSLIIPYLGFLALFLGPLIGGVAAEAVRTAVGRRRSNTLFVSAAVGAAVGCGVLVFRSLIYFNIWGMLWAGVYAFTATSTIYYRLRGIRL